MQSANWLARTPRSICFGGHDGFADDVHQLSRLIDQRFQLGRSDELRLHGEAQPDSRFPKFFQNNAQFVDEIRTALSRTSFTVIRSWRSAAADELPRDVPPHS